MITSLGFYLAATVLLAGIDAFRIRVQWGRVQNISKVPSAILAVLAGAVWFIFKPNIYLFLPGCIGVRLLFYSPVLNVFRGRSFNYISNQTNAITDHFLKAWWLQRAIGAGIVGTVLIINLFV